ncbi:MAG: O-antigen ligase family protein [Burkholderiaceae bacterium]
MSAWIGIIAVAGLLGALLPGYVALMGDSPLKLMALPAAIVLGFLLAYSRTTLLLMLVFSRGATEVLFDSTRMAVGGMQIGVGGLINGFAILIALLLVIEKPQLLSKTVWKVWAPFLVLICFGTFVAPDRSTAARLFLQLLSEFAVFVGAWYFVRTDNDYRTCIKLILWSSVIPVAYGFIELASGGGHEYANEGLRLRSTFSHPNVFAFFLTLIIALTLYVGKGRSFALGPVKRFILNAYLPLLLLMLLLTKTRSAWVACAAMFIGYALLFERRYFVYLILAGVAGLFIPGVGDRLFDLTQGGGNSISSYDRLNSFAWRESIWRSGFDSMSPIHYVYGYGLEAFKFFSPTFFRESNGVNWGAHNVYVQLFFDLGVLGVMAFVWMYGQLLKGLRSVIAFDRLGSLMLSFVVVAFLLMAASDNMLDYLSFNWYLWFLFGAGLSYAGLHATPRDEAVVEG